MLYFDHNATTPLHPAARDAWLEASAQFIGNPSSPHRLGARADAALQTARERLAAWMDCEPFDLVWTSGATESNNTVFFHATRTLPSDVEVWVSAVEHPCVLAAAERWFPGRHRLIPVDKNGVIELGWLREQLPQKPPGLVAVMAANNETGVLQPWREALSLCREWEVPFFCDAVQWLGKLSPRELGDCDFLSGCAHKFGGPRGVGFLKWPSTGRAEPLIVGGPQEDGRRAGTENVPGVLALLAALEAREESLTGGEHLERFLWRGTFEQQLIENLPGSEIVGAGAERLWNTVSALMPEADCQQRWVVKLDKLNCAVSTGSACASGHEKPSHVLAAMGYPPSAASRVLRFSAGWETTPADWQSLLQKLQTVHAQISSAAS